MTLGTANRPKGLTTKHCEKRDTDQFFYALVDHIRKALRL